MLLSKALGIERARLVHLLNGLEARKSWSVAGPKTDRRSHALHLSAKGRSALADIKALAQEHEQHLKEDWTQRPSIAVTPARVLRLWLNQFRTTILSYQQANVRRIRGCR